MGNRTLCGGAAAQHCVDECTKLQLELESRSRDGEGRSRDQEEPDCDPAGAIFNETLRSTNQLDQEALRFASSTNLSAVRWLLFMGASPTARDRNGTTMLHAACRSGSLSIVQELVAYGLSLDAVDTSGWTPLHIAAVMGRREVCLLLLRARGRLDVQNKRGRTPLSLCSDHTTKEVLEQHQEAQDTRLGGPVGDTHSNSSFKRGYQGDGPSTTSSGHDEHESTCEPFFVPRFPLFHDELHRVQLVRIGINMLNRSPGHGLAFLVATGAVHDHPTDLSSFVLQNGADPTKLGEFLGEDFSLAQTLRLALIHSVELKGTGIVGALQKTFKHLRAPRDLSKIDRITSGIAHLWWRCHDDVDEDWEEVQVHVQDPEWMLHPEAVGEEPPRLPQYSPEAQELTGLELRRHFRSVEGFRRIMFSSVMLSWNLHAPRLYNMAPMSPKRLSVAEWMELNGNLETDGGSIPDHVQKSVYHKLLEQPSPQLLPEFSDSLPPGATPLVPPTDHTLSLQGWASIPQGGIERLDPLVHGGGRLAHCIFSETSSSPNQPVLTPGLLHRGYPRKAESGGERVWLSLSHALFLFLSSGPGDPAPYAFIRLQGAVVRDVDLTSQRLVLAGKPKIRQGLGYDTNSREDGLTHGRGLKEKNGEGPEPPSLSRNLNPFSDSRQPLSICFLLADGRFQPFEALWLEMQFSTDEDVTMWAEELDSICDSLDQYQTEHGQKMAGLRTRAQQGTSHRGPTTRVCGPAAPAPPVLAEDLTEGLMVRHQLGNDIGGNGGGTTSGAAVAAVAAAEAAASAAVRAAASVRGGSTTVPEP